MSNVDLKFSGNYTTPVGSGVDLLFGANNDGPPLSVVEFHAVIPAPVLAIDAERTKPLPVTVEFSVVVAAPVLQSIATYDNRVYRPTKAVSGGAWQPATQFGTSGEDAAWQTTKTLNPLRATNWEEGVPAIKSSDSTLKALSPFKFRSGVSYENADPSNVGADLDYEYMIKRPTHEVMPWDVGQMRQAERVDDFEYLIRKPKKARYPWERPSGVWKASSQPSQVGKKFWHSHKLPWEQGKVFPKDWTQDGPTAHPEPPETTHSWDLLFTCQLTDISPLAVLLKFKHGVPYCPYEPPPTPEEVTGRKVYFIVNELTFKRVSDDTPIEITSVSVAEQNSWAWTFTGQIPYSELEKVEPSVAGPVEVELSINGVVWRFLIETYDDNRVFGKTGFTIRGRSVTAWLDAPYAPTRSFSQTMAMSSRQFAEAELVRPGLVSGFTLDWTLIDALGWDMPEGTWSYADQTPMQVIRAIAEGGGGYVNSHPSEKTVQVKNLYPVPYWDWATATVDKTIPYSLVTNQSLQYSEKPDYTGVMVAGERTGVTALVRKLGTDGGNMAPMVVSPFISDLDAATNRGRTVLSAGGKQAQVNLQMPMHPDVGLVTSGMLINVSNAGMISIPSWRGLARGTTVSAAWQQGLKVKQTIALERHYG